MSSLIGIDPASVKAIKIIRTAEAAQIAKIEIRISFRRADILVRRHWRVRKPALQ
jgi:hypothetical protein